MSKGQSLQDPFLNTLRKERVPVSIFLVNGIKLQGEIESFDQFVILLRNNVSQMVYKHANAKDLEAMVAVVEPQKEVAPVVRLDLSQDAKNEISSIFKLYDKDKSGALSVSELKKALEKTGIEPEEIKTYFKEYDKDGNQEIDKAEWSHQCQRRKYEGVATTRMVLSKADLCST